MEHGHDVKLDDAKEGDIVLYGYSATDIVHAAMYVGAGEWSWGVMMNAPW